MYIVKHSKGLAKFLMLYLFFGTNKTFFEQVPSGNLLVPGQVSIFISTPLLIVLFVLIQEEIREKENKCQKLSVEKEAKETSETELSSQVRSHQS